MKRVIKLALLGAVLMLSACSTSKQASAPNTDTVQYRLPACHQVIHQKMLDQQKLYNNSL